MQVQIWYHVSHFQTLFTGWNHYSALIWWRGRVAQCHTLSKPYDRTLARAALKSLKVWVQAIFTPHELPCWKIVVLILLLPMCVVDCCWWLWGGKERSETEASYVLLKPRPSDHSYVQDSVLVKLSSLTFHWLWVYHCNRWGAHLRWQ